MTAPTEAAVAGAAPALCVFTRSWRSSGAGLFAQSLVDGLLAEGAQVTFVCPPVEDARFERARAGLRRIRPPRERTGRASRPAKVVASLARMIGGAIGVLLIGGGAERRLLRDVEELADRHLAAHRRVGAAGVAGAGCRGLGESVLEQIVAPGDEEVAEQDRGGAAERRGVADPPGVPVRGLESAVRRGAPAARVGAVDDVVVHERGGVEDLQRRGCGDHLGGRHRGRAGGLLHRPPPGDAEPGTQALAAGEGRRSGFDEQTRLVAEPVGVRSLGREEIVESLGNLSDRI